MRQENRLRRLEDRRTALSPSDGVQRLGEFLDRLSDRLTGTENVATASPAMVAAIALRGGRLASPAVLRRAEALSAYPGPVGKLFEGILGGMA